MATPHPSFLRPNKNGGNDDDHDHDYHHDHDDEKGNAVLEFDENKADGTLGESLLPRDSQGQGQGGQKRESVGKGGVFNDRLTVKDAYEGRVVQGTEFDSDLWGGKSGDFKGGVMWVDNIWSDDKEENIILMYFLVWVMVLRSVQD